MKKSLEELHDNIKKCDVVIYVLDARCPDACRNPEFDKIIGQKRVIYYYSKRDMSPNPNAVPNVRVLDEIKKMFPDRVGGSPKQSGTPAQNTPPASLRFVKAMVIGVPNVGKSTLINKLAKRAKCKTENRPGVTKQIQWVEVAPKIYLMDTPGVLWGNIDDQNVARELLKIDAIPKHLFKLDGEK
jgi:ribosome biogenesis GTPase A